MSNWITFVGLGMLIAPAVISVGELFWFTYREREWKFLAFLCWLFGGVGMTVAGLLMAAPNA